MQRELVEGSPIREITEPSEDSHSISINPQFQGQGNRNTCVPFAATAAVEAHIHQTVKNVDVSEELSHYQLYSLSHLDIEADDGYSLRIPLSFRRSASFFPGICLAIYPIS